jgi:NAD(P)-dependent dehydrogenase (short-subunit alcohol dehydrogenase family)
MALVGKSPVGSPNAVRPCCWAAATRAAGKPSLFAAATDGLAYASSKSSVTMLTLKYAQAFLADPALAHIKINAVTPG